MSRAFSGGKRQREADRDRRKKAKEDRLRYNRQVRSQSGEPEIEPASNLDGSASLPEVKLEDVVISVASRPRRGVGGPTKLFVGGISFDTTTERLREAFARLGNVVDAAVILDRSTGRSRGFGFVTFETAEEADGAVQKMNGAELDGRSLKVNRAEAR